MALHKKKGDDIINNINKTLVNSINKGLSLLDEQKYVDITNKEKEIEEKMPILYSAWKQSLFDTKEYPWCNANRQQLTVPSQSVEPDENAINYGKASEELQKAVPTAFVAAANGKSSQGQVDIIPPLAQMARNCIDDNAYKKWKPSKAMTQQQAKEIIDQTPKRLNALAKNEFYKMFQEIEAYVQKTKD